jgi:hypothetical protein
MKRFLIIQDAMVNNGVDAEQYHEDVVWVTDYRWWHQVQTEFGAWLAEHDCKMQGLVVKFPREETLSLFLLRWQ